MEEVGGNHVLEILHLPGVLRSLLRVGPVPKELVHQLFNLGRFPPPFVSAIAHFGLDDD